MLAAVKAWPAITIVLTLLLSLETFAQPFTCTAPPSGITAWWKAESNTIDSINGNNGTFGGTVSYIPGEVGLAFNFDGASYVAVPDSGSLRFTNGMTVEAWVNVNQYNLNQYTSRATEILSKLAGGGVQQNSYTLSIEGANTAPTHRAYFTVVNTNYVATQLFSSTQIPTNQWVHIAGTYDGVTIKIYINGVLSASQADAGGIFPGTAQLNIGSSGPTSFFNGQIDEVSLYDRALSPSEIADIYNARTAGKCGDGIAPTITEEPTNETVFVGGSATFSVTVSASSPNYQWFDGSNSITGATDSTLTLTNVQFSDAGNYYVTVSNQYGSTNSATAILTVTSGPPAITTEPTNQSAIAGDSASFSVTVIGNPPLSYQWYNGSGSIMGATNSTLTLNNVQSSDAGDYYVMISNPLGSTNSANAILTVVVPACIPPPTGIVAWWRAEGDSTLDIVGGNNGVFLGEPSFTTGKVGQAFNFDGNSYVQVPDSDSLHFTNTMTVECWVNSSTASGEIVSKLGAAWFYQNAFTLGFDPGTQTPHFGVNSQIPTGDYQISIGVHGTNAIPTNQWVHLAATVDGTNVNLYVNGALAGSVPWTQGIFPGNQPLLIGSVLNGAGNPTSYANGQIDEVSLYNRALSQSEIAAIYNARGAGKCVNGVAPTITAGPTNQTAAVDGNASFSVAATGWSPLSYQWYNSSGSIPDATGPTLTLYNVQLSDAGTYYVTASNPYGSTNSTSVILMVTNPPSCTPPPSDMVAWWRAEDNTLDSVGTNNGTFGETYGPNPSPYTNGEAGQAFNFDGQSYVEVPDSSSLRFTNTMTVECWINVSSYGGAQTREAVEKSGFSLGLDPATQTPYFGVLSSNSILSSTLTRGTAAIPLNQWVHLAGTVDGTNVNIYVNGAIVGSVPWTRGIFVDTSPLEIGCVLADGRGSYFNGQVDEVSLYKRALNPGEIAAIYNAGIAGKCIGVNPTITGEPTDQTAVVGGSASFTVTASSPSPLSYQWYSSGESIAGGTNSTLTLSNVQLSDAGSYYAIVDNTSGSTNSINATLTVTNPVTTCVPPPLGLVAWWQGESNTVDIVSGNNGIFYGVPSYTIGEVGEAFNLDGNSYVQVPDSGSLHFTTTMTVECWVNLRTYSGANTREVVSKLGANQSAFTLGFDPSTQTPHFNVASLTNDTVSIQVNGTNPVPTNQWVHLAATVDGSNVNLYVDGAIAGSVPWTQGIFPGNAPLMIGCVSQGPTSFFNGQIDEVSLYTRALSPGEIAAIFNARTAGKCVIAVPPSITEEPATQSVPVGASASLSVGAGGSPLLSYQWFSGSDGIAGATNSTLTLSNLQLANSGNYSVTVANPYGSVMSSNVLLAVLSPPSLTSSLTLLHFGAFISISWPISPPGFVLESSATLLPGSWTPVPGSPLQSNGENLQLVPITGTNQFFRLQYSEP